MEHKYQYKLIGFGNPPIEDNGAILVDASVYERIVPYAAFCPVDEMPEVDFKENAHRQVDSNGDWIVMHTLVFDLRMRGVVDHCRKNALIPGIAIQ